MKRYQELASFDFGFLPNRLILGEPETDQQASESTCCTAGKRAFNPTEMSCGQRSDNHKWTNAWHYQEGGPNQQFKNAACPGINFSPGASDNAARYEANRSLNRFEVLAYDR